MCVCYAHARFERNRTGQNVTYQPEKHHTSLVTVQNLTTIWLESLLDRVPGLMILASLMFCVIGAIWFPYILASIAAGLALYALLRLISVGIASVRGLKRIAEWEQVNWQERFAAYTAGAPLQWHDIHHLVIIPNYQEPLHILRKTLSNLAASPEAPQMTIVLAMEADEPDGTVKAEILQAEFAACFAHCFHTRHPSQIPGELRCKSANQAWALRYARRKLVETFGYNPDHIIVTTMDADTLWHPQYFCALTYQFATDPARHTCFWQAPIRYHGNIYDSNPVLRLTNVYTTATELAYLQASWWQSLPISSYSISLNLLDSTGGWDTDVIADEWHMYVKAFFARRGQIHLKPIFLPFLANVVTGDTLWETFKKRYAQTLRHAWGSKEIGYTIAQMLRHPDTNLLKSLRVLVSVWHDLFLSSAGWIVMTLGGQLPLLLHPSIREQMLHHIWRYPPFLIFQIVGAVLLILGIVFLILDIQLRPPRPHPASRREQLESLLGFVLLPVFGVVFIVVPVFHAQLRLLVGRPLAFTVTPKG